MLAKKLLKEISLFSDIEDDELEKFVEICDERNYDNGEVVLEEGVEGDALYIVKEGQVEVTKVEGEVRSTLVTLEAGEHFGEMSLLESQPTSARVSADGRLSLLLIPREKFAKLLEQDINVAAKVYKALAFALSRRLRSTSADLATWKPGFDF